MFLVLIPIIIGLINYYLFRTAAVAYPGQTIFWATCISLLYLSLFAAVILERTGKLRASLPFSWIGYTWLGVSGIALALTAATDLAQLAVPALSDRSQFLAVSVATSLLSIVAAFSAQRVAIKRVRVNSPRLRLAKRSLTVAQISDLHLGESSSLSRARKIVDAINAAQPDIIVSTGDLFDGYLDLMAPFVECLRTLEAPLGKYAVSGNHEVYAGLEDAMSLTQLAGFTLLRNESQSPLPKLRIAGVEDPAGPNPPLETATLSPASKDEFVILLKHRPEIAPDSIGKFDLQLSGHTHGGQIAPFHLLTKLAYKAKVGLSEIAPNQFLYLSRGTGSWGPQLRLLAPCEITLLEIATGGDPQLES